MSDLKRCSWCGEDDLYIEYHDREWGREVFDDRKMFEFLILEGAQAGLSWLTILRRRENYRRAFANFDPVAVACFTPADVERLMNDPGIIRNRRKIESAVTNARNFLEICREFGSFRSYLLSFFPGGKRIVNQIRSMAEIPARSEISDAISCDMKKRGFKFFGSVICYSHLQATGLVDDHIEGCFAKNQK